MSDDHKQADWITLRDAAKRFAAQPKIKGHKLTELAVLTVIQHVIGTRELMAQAEIEQHELGLLLLNPDKTLIQLENFNHWLAKIRADPDNLLMYSEYNPRPNVAAMYEERMMELQRRAKATGRHHIEERVKVLEIALRLLDARPADFRNKKGVVVATELATEIHKNRSVFGLEKSWPNVETIVDHLRHALIRSNSPTTIKKQ